MWNTWHNIYIPYGVAVKGGGSVAGEGTHVSEPKFCSRVRCNTNVDVRVILFVMWILYSKNATTMYNSEIVQMLSFCMKLIFFLMCQLRTVQCLRKLKWAHAYYSHKMHLRIGRQPWDVSCFYDFFCGRIHTSNLGLTSVWTFLK